MSDEQLSFLSLLGQPQGRFSPEQTAWALNFEQRAIPILVAAKLLKPLGSPPTNGQKFFAAVEVLKLAKDPVWLGKATNAVHHYWHAKNQRKNGFVERREPQNDTHWHDEPEK